MTERTQALGRRPEPLAIKSHLVAIRAAFARVRPMVIVLFGIVVATPQAAYAQAVPAVVESDEAAVRALWSALDSHWNARDADRLSRLFTDDASFRFVDRGQSLESRASILQHFAKQFSRQAPELRHRATVRESRSVAPNVVALDGDVEVLRMGSEESVPPAVVRRFAIFAVMRKTAEGWQIHLLRVFQLPTADASKQNGA